ncbi:unnamed protein product [Pylaiella littoralis]
MQIKRTKKRACSGIGAETFIRTRGLSSRSVRSCRKNSSLAFSFAPRAGCRPSVTILAAPSSRTMVSQVPRRRSSALDTPRTGWWTSKARGAPTVAAPSYRAMVWRVPRRRSSALDTPRTGW